MEPFEKRTHLAASPAVVVSLSPAPVGLALVDSADFDRDGVDDLLLHDPAAGRYVVWLMEPLDSTFHVPRREEIPLPAVAAGWEVIAAGDLSGDGKPDLLWHHAGLRATNVWTLDGASLQTIKRIATANPSPTPWRPIDVADINNDGRDDIVWMRANPSPPRYSAWYKADDDSLTTYSFGGLPYPANPAWRIHAFADFDLDAKTDALLIHTDGRRLIWRLDNKVLLKTIPIGQGNTESSLVLADIDEDGDPDLIYQSMTDRSQTFAVRMNKDQVDLGVLL